MKIKLSKIRAPKLPNTVKKLLVKANVKRKKIKLKRLIKNSIKISIIIFISILIISIITAKFSDLLYPIKYQAATIFMQNDLEKKYYLLNEQVESLNHQISNSNCVKAKYIEQNIIITTREINEFAIKQYSPDNFHPSNYFERINIAIGKINNAQNNCFDLSSFTRYIDSIELVDIFENQKIQEIGKIVENFRVKFKENKKLLDDNIITDQNIIDKYLELLGLSKRELQALPAEINGENFKSSYVSVLKLKHLEDELNNISKPTEGTTTYTNFSEQNARDFCLLFPHNETECTEETISGIWNSINSIEVNSTRIIKSAETLKSMSLFGIQD